MTRDEYELWHTKVALLESQFARIESGAKAILGEMGCSADPVQIYAILAGEQKAPWPARTAERSIRRAKQAMYALLYLGKARAALGPRNPDAPSAADSALSLGWLTSQLGLELVTKARATKGGHKRGTQIANKAAANDPAVKKHLRRWENSDELQDQHRSAASYIQKKTGLPRRTIERSLKRITTAKSRQ